jgi:hypothetical protein
MAGMAALDLLPGDDLRAQPDMDKGGELNGSHAPIPNDVNLTAEGTLDWSHWGLVVATDLDRKASNNTALIMATISAPPQQYATYIPGFSWTDGTPAAMINANHGGIYLSTVGDAFTITVPADTEARTLHLYLTNYESTASLRAHLSDGSAADYTDMQTVTNNIYYRYTFVYRAASAGQTLTIGWTLNAQTTAFGSIDLLAASLSD